MCVLLDLCSSVQANGKRGNSKPLLDEFDVFSSVKLLPMCKYLWIHYGMLAGNHADPFFSFLLVD